MTNDDLTNHNYCQSKCCVDLYRVGEKLLLTIQESGKLLIIMC